MTVYIKFDPSDAKMYDSRSSSSDDYVVDLYLGENLSFLGHFPQVLGKLHFLDLGTLSVSQDYPIDDQGNFKG